MGFFDTISERISDAFDDENIEKARKFKKGRSLSSIDGKAGVEMMLKNARTENDFKVAAAVHWREVKIAKGESAANNDDEYKRIMGLAANAKY